MGFSAFSGFFEILKETFKIFFTNGKLIPSFTLLNISLNSIVMLLYLYFSKLLLTDYTVKLTDLVLDLSNTESPPDSPNSLYAKLVSLMRDEIFCFTLAYLILSVVLTFTSLLFTITMILASAKVFSGKQIYAKELVAMTWKSLPRVFVTFAYTTLLCLGYTLLVLAFVILPLEFIFLDSLIQGKTSQLTNFALVFVAIPYFYLAVVWTLAFVTSVIEEINGFEALWKASELAKGLKLRGFLLKLLFGGLSLASFIVYKTSSSHTMDLKAVFGFSVFLFVLLISMSTLIGVFSSISFTVLYFEGKKIHGDELEMKGYTVKYAKLPVSAPLSSSNMS